MSLCVSAHSTLCYALSLLGTPVCETHFMIIKLRRVTITSVRKRSDFTVWPCRTPALTQVDNGLKSCEIIWGLAVLSRVSNPDGLITAFRTASPAQAPTAYTPCGGEGGLTVTGLSCQLQRQPS